MRKTNGVRRIRRSAAQWSRLIEEQAASGLSQRAFCEAHGLAPSSFAKAARRPAPGAVQQPSDDSPGFVPVTVEGASAERWDLEIQLGASLSIRVRGG